MYNSRAKFRVVVPFVDDMGSITPFIVTATAYETKARAALDFLNRMRDHDALPHLSRMPNGTTYTRIEE